ncbi:AcrR family transcriptional regulator [Deinobacterium chartae]|uniref:AcrR family transcriptional regulator n=1 Tax=Deinobacterium chartae TaxID=521158 RepID=A0A841I2P3_9DEIO|nr:TetR/AcrR family transcriptional regulator [Deinobacterium chartae]MBB6099543.1 AcrR family transcriptional regulator [Deinobacterium chartae]
MKKGERTRRQLLDRAADLLNRHGYLGTPFSRISAAVGLEKGGIYNYFTSREELGLAAFDHAAERASARLRRALEEHPDPRSRLSALLEVFRDYLHNPPVPGGCPLINAAVESDGTHPALRTRVRAAVGSLHDLTARLIREAQRSGDLRTALEPEEAASVIIATLEGAIMLARLEDDPLHLERAVRHLRTYLELPAPSPALKEPYA